MASRVMSVGVYFVVLIALVVLTLATVGVSFLDLPGRWHMALGLSIAAVKAGLVVCFFMHAISSPRLTWIVILAACTGGVILFGLTLCDYFGRGLIPFTPGH